MFKPYDYDYVEGRRGDLGTKEKSMRLRYEHVYATVLNEDNKDHFNEMERQAVDGMTHTEDLIPSYRLEDTFETRLTPGVSISVRGVERQKKQQNNVSYISFVAPAACVETPGPALDFFAAHSVKAASICYNDLQSEKIVNIETVLDKVRSPARNRDHHLFEAQYKYGASFAAEYAKGAAWAAVAFVCEPIRIGIERRRLDICDDFALRVHPDIDLDAVQEEMEKPNPEKTSFTNLRPSPPALQRFENLAKHFSAEVHNVLGIGPADPKAEAQRRCDRLRHVQNGVAPL